MLGCIMSVHFFYAQQLVPSKKEQKAFAQIDFLPIKMPGNEVAMDYAGIHYNAFLNDWSYAGLGFYGAVGGIRGGFFTLGVNLGVRHHITKSLFVDGGIHFGGGGGAAAPDGGGAFILPHLNLGYDFGKFSATAGYSYVDFFDGGTIQSSQVNVAVQIPLNFSHASLKNREMRLDEAILTASPWGLLGKRASLLVHLNNLRVTKGSYTGRTIRLAGFEFNSYFSDNFFYFIKADGAYHGIRAGYMDILVGAGYHLSMNKNRTNLLAKFGIGAGGGGGVDTKGGFLIYPDISLEQKLYDNLYLSINKGYLMSPDSHFVSSSYGIGMKYYVDQGGSKSNQIAFSEGVFKGIEVIVKHDYYPGAQRDPGYSQDMHQIAMQLNFFFNKYIYGAGQTAFANFGDAGAYAEGIVGLGVKSPMLLNNRASFFAQVLGGAAGGGGISTGQGLIFKPSVGLNYEVFDALALRAGVGYVKARGGALNTHFYNFGLSYRFSLLSMKK